MHFRSKGIAKALGFSKSSKKGSSNSSEKNTNTQQGPSSTGATQSGLEPEPSTGSISTPRNKSSAQEAPTSRVTAAARDAVTDVEVSEPKLELLHTATKRDSVPHSATISELWDEAYEELRKKDRSLIESYEKELFKGISGVAMLAGQVSAGFSGIGTIERRQQIKLIIDRKIKEAEDGTWKLKFKDHELVVKDLIEPVVGVVDWAKNYVGTALEASPAGSIAWTGVCLLLPLVLNPFKQATSRVKGLETISSILSQCHIREELYRCRYELKSVHGITKDSPSSHIAYRGALRALYVELLTFQATFVQFLSKQTVVKVAGDMVKWQTWDTMLDKIKDRENELRAIEEQWRDRKYEEQYELQTSHHQERMKMSEAIENEISRVLAVLFDPQNNSERRKLLDWLSPVDPSTNYNSARKKHGISTGDWLTKR